MRSQVPQQMRNLVETIGALPSAGQEYQLEQVLQLQLEAVLTAAQDALSQETPLLAPVLEKQARKILLLHLAVAMAPR